MKIRSIEDSCVALANAIIVQAAEDYRSSCRRLKRKADDHLAKKEKTACEEFFKSQYFSSLSQADGPSILRKLEEEQENLNRRKKA